VDIEIRVIRKEKAIQDAMQYVDVMQSMLEDNTTNFPECREWSETFSECEFTQNGVRSLFVPRLYLHKS
jgi:hypothetical protein